MSRFFDDLEAQLDEAARAQAARPQTGDRSRARWRRLRSGARAVPLALAIAVPVLVVVAIGLTLRGGHHSPGTASTSVGHAGTSAHHALPPTASASSVTRYGSAQVRLLGDGTPLSPQEQHEVKYAFAAQAKAMRTSACNPSAPPRATVSDASPGPQVLSWLGVLRRPATPADHLTVSPTSGAAYPADAQKVYVRYIRRARIKDGVSYWIVPAGRLAGPPSFDRRCRAAQVAELRRELPKIPAVDRASTLALEARMSAPPAGYSGAAICVTDLNAGGGGGGTCGTAGQTRQGGLLMAEGSTLIGVVPDGVTSVTLHYGAGRGLPPLTTATDVAGNVFAVSIARIETGGFPSKMIWRSANGKVIKTISQQPG